MSYDLDPAFQADRDLSGCLHARRAWPAPGEAMNPIAAYVLLTDLARNQPMWSDDPDERQALLLSRRETWFLMELLSEWQLQESARMVFVAGREERRLALALDTKLRKFFFRPGGLRDEPSAVAVELDRAMLDPFAAPWRAIKTFVRDALHRSGARP